MDGATPYVAATLKHPGTSIGRPEIAQRGFPRVLKASLEPFRTLAFETVKLDMSYAALRVAFF